MRTLGLCLLSTGLLALLTAAATASERLDPTAQSAALGGEVSVIDRELNLNASGVDVLAIDASGPFVGVSGYYRTSRLFRVEGRLLGGNIDVDSNNGVLDESGQGVLGELRATAGMQLYPQARLYAGLGAEQLYGDFDDVDYDSRSVYIPVGASAAKSMTTNWDLMTTLEGRLIIDGAEKISGITRIDDTTFARSGGFGTSTRR